VGAHWSVVENPCQKKKLKLMPKTKNKQKKINLSQIFIPIYKNDFRPHAFRHRMLALYSFLLLSSQVLLGIAYVSGPSLVSENLVTMEKNIIALTNQEREKENIGTLIQNPQLDEAAQLKLNDMFKNNYWDHISPEGNQAWDFINLTTYKYSFAGENLARGFVDANSTVAAWMASPSHKKNILNTRFRDMGLAIGQGEIDGKPTILVVQIFGSPQSALTIVNIKESSQATNEAKTIASFSQKNITIRDRLPYFVFWLILFFLIIFDGLVIRKLGLHHSKKHLFQFRSALIVNIIVLIVLSLNYVSIA